MTLKEQLDVLLAPVAVQVTVVVPMGKVEPGAGEQTVAALPQTSDAVGVAKLTTMPAL